MEPGFLTLAFGLVFIGGCSARVVTVSPGPLIRVEGQPVSIRCDVNDYGGPSEQDFDWEMSRDETGPKSRIISTFESDFSDALFSRRVASGDISVVRLQDNEAELKIAEVKLTDAGFYLCRTPSTDPTTSGNYYAQVQLRVIPNTLKVSPQTPSPVVQEGQELTLSCSVTRELAFPSLTYLSVAWLVKTGGSSGSEEILTFGPQRDVVTGQRFARRYLDGDLRLVPGRNGTFELVISRVTASDEGTYVCTGSEWTRESGGKWTKIVESSKEMGAVSVTPTNCDQFAAADRNFIVPLGYQLKPTDTLKWEFNGNIIFDKKQERISTGKESDINSDGSLQLINLSENQAGLYTADVYDKDGKAMIQKSTNLCVLDCDQFAAADRNFIVPLGHQLKPTDSLKWEFNGNIIFYKTSAEVVIGRTDDINEDGSLKLMNLRKSQMGRYTSEVSDGTRKARTMKEIDLCVLDSVKKPQVNATCQDGNVTFHCFLGSQPVDVKYEWLQNGAKLQESNLTFEMKAAETKDGKFVCKVFNEASSETSEPVANNCAKIGFPDELHKNRFWILNGFRVVVAVLLIITVTVCCVRVKRKRKKQLINDVELPLKQTDTEQPSSSSPSSSSS